MPELTISIGGRDFQVACKEGEEHYLTSAAAMLDAEAQALKEALGRLPETRMLLMAGLMLADKTASLEDELRKRPLDPNAEAKRQLARAQEVLQGALDELARSKNEQAQMATQLSSINAALRDEQARHEGLRERAEAADSEAKAAQDDLVALRVALKEAESLLQSERSTPRIAPEAHQAVQDELSAAKDAHDTLAAEHAALEEAHKTAQAEHAAAAEALDTALKSAQKELKATQGAQSAAQKELEALEASYRAVVERMVAFE